MFNYLFRAFDPRHIEVVLHRSRYRGHIWIQHGIAVEEIRDVIESPDIITMDADDDEIENYYAQGVIADAPELFLKVCVLFKQDQGRVITAFDVDSPYPEEEIIWQK